ncbi:disease resistance protein RUN1-like isoform X2 [Phaseolus vulgaris]|uniref:disease resistance protein RUN1-like isoform X2 n=1 Tax=Phaseolus vulgaris TaxID=3885 RepID=UPI0035CA1E69
MDYMNENESIELFSWHAFGAAKPREDFNELARNMVAYCRGLQLDLEVLGSFLSHKTMKKWESVSSKAKVIPIHKIQESLRISFDDLSNVEKHIFLDVCCFFVGKDKGYVTDILNGCELYADIGITVLIEPGLIKVERNNKLEMPSLLRDMGREIIRQSWPKEPGKRSRLWVQDDVKDVLKENTGTEAIQGLSLKLHSTSRDCFKAHAFREMKGLRLLQLDHVQLTGDYGF